MVTPVDCHHVIDGDGPPVVMIHGIGASHQTWDGVVPHLESHYRCIRFDLRGHGDSPVPPGPYTLDDLVADVERLRDRLGLARVHVVGHSLGGMIGPAYARAYPDRVLSVGLLSTAAGRTAEDSAKVRGVVAAMEEKGVKPVLDTLVDRWFTPEFAAARPEVIERRLDRVLATPAEVFLNVFHIYAETEMAPWLHEVRAPTLVLTGEHDGGCNPRLNRYMAETLPNAELVILDRLRHAILLEAPEVVALHLKAFLDRVDGA